MEFRSFNDKRCALILLEWWNSDDSITFIFSGTFPNIFNDFSIYNSKNAAQFKSMQTDTMLITRTKFYKLTRDQSHV